MKKLTKALVCVAMAVFLCLPAAACGGGQGDPDQLSIFGWSLASVQTAQKTNTPIYAKIKKNTGVDLKVHSVNSAAFDEALNKLFNMRELTDLFITYGPEKPALYEKMIKDGAILPVSDYVSESKYPNLHKHLQQYEFLEDNLYYAEGKQWSIPTNHSLEHAIYVRQDWIDNLNQPEKLRTILTEELGRTPTEEELETMKFKLPDTLLEFYRLARAFTKYDPDGNGQHDTYGYTGASDMWSENWIYIAFSGGYQQMVPNGEGGYTSSDASEGAKQAIAFINRLHNEGIMHPDWQTDTFSDKQDKFCQDKVGIIEAHCWFNNIVTGYISAHADQSIEEASGRIAMIAPPAGPDGTRGILGHPGFWTAVCINANIGEAKIEKALTLMDYLYSPEGQDLFVYGVEGENYKVENGEKVSLMGKNASGFNYTVASYDAAYPLSAFCNWTADYFSPFATNADKIIAQMEAAKAYATVEEHPMVQTPLYVKNFEGMISFAEESFMDMITSESNYREPAGGEVTWENLYSYNAAFNESWNAYIDKYMGDYQGKATIDEYNEYIRNIA